ncbi:MAG: hypothetical protein IAI50_09895 [Candidatus Eremiobacteraeota bacterium]|nr:hypothetical protein [Candidatus Eremiobacteraeota bacterium]
MDRRLALGALFCVTFGVAACTTGGGNVTYPNPLNPTPGPAASPTVAPTTAAASTETIALPVGGGTIPIPNYSDFTGTATIPALTVGGGATVTLTDSTSALASPATAPIPAGQTGVFFVELTLSKTVTFASANIPTTITSASAITPGATYTANVYALGGPVQATQTAVAAGHSLTFTIIVPGSSFPGGVPADVVISH